MLPLSLLLLAAAVSTSHAVARIDHRVLLAAATAAHHLGTAAWIGAMPFLLISLARAGSVEEARRMVRRYSQMALLSVATLILAGIGLAWFYVGAWSGLYGTAYGVMLLAKIYLAAGHGGSGRRQLAARAAAEHAIPNHCWRGCGVLLKRRSGWDSPPCSPRLR